jgi:flagellar basal-body rod protein FlgF
MQPILEVTLGAMQHDVARLERVATNLANVTTPGYKREMWVQSAEPTGSASAFARLVETASSIEPSTSGSEPQTHGEIARDARPGTLKPTGQSLDIALTGPGWFELATEQGPAYTRHGQFHLDSRGRVVNIEGHALMGKGGEVVLSGTGATIDASGKVHESGRLVDQIRVVEFESGAQLVARGAGLFNSAGHARTMEDGAVRLRQGFLESANVDSAQEMVTLTQTMRHFESLHRVIQGYDDMLGTAIRKLGDL